MNKPETPAVTRTRRNMTPHEKEQLADWIARRLEAMPDASSLSLHRLALQELGYPAGRSTFDAYLGAARAKVAADLPTSPAELPTASVDDQLADTAAAATQLYVPATTPLHELPVDLTTTIRQRRAMTTETGAVELVQTADGEWVLRAELRYRDRSAAIDHFRALEDQVESAA